MKKPKVKWLDRRVAMPGPYLALCLSAEELSSAAQQCGIKNMDGFPESGATTFTLENKDGDICCLIGVSHAAQKEEPLLIAGLLVHEAVHVWQHHKRDISEKRPGDEQEAYAIQGISQELMMEYARRLK